MKVFKMEIIIQSALTWLKYQQLFVFTQYQKYAASMSSQYIRLVIFLYPAAWMQIQSS